MYYHVKKCPNRFGNVNTKVNKVKVEAPVEETVTYSSTSSVEESLEEEFIEASEYAMEYYEIEMLDDAEIPDENNEFLQILGI